MTRKDILKKAYELEEKNYVTVLEWEEDGDIDITIQDFLGFDENWSEIMNDKLDNKAINAFLKKMENACDKFEEGFYSPDEYTFKDFVVSVDYSSFSI